jgi:hypothetical protein
MAGIDPDEEFKEKGFIACCQMDFQALLKEG